MSSLKKNIIYNTIYQVLVIILPLITAPYIARVLGKNGVGIYSYTHSIANYFVLFAMLGISNYGNRSISVKRNNKEEMSKEFWSIYLLQVITSSICIIFYLLYVLFLKPKFKIAAIVQIFYVISPLFDISWFFFGIEEFKLTVGRNLIIKIMSLLLIFIFVKSNNDVYTYIFIMAISTLISQFYMWFFVKKYILFIKVKFKEVFKHLKQVIILFVPAISFSVYKILSKIMLGLLGDISSVGLFENAEKLINIPMGFITAFGTVMIPRMSYLYSVNDKEKSKVYLENSLNIICWISSALAFGLMAIGRDFAPIFYGEDFIDSGKIIVILAITIIFISIANVIRTQYLIPNKEDKIYVISTIVGAVVNFTINLVTIPIWGYFGAALGTLLAEFFVMFVQIIGVRKKIPIRKYIKINYIYFIFGIIMFLALNFIGSMLNYNGVKLLIIKIISGVFIYIILSLLYFIKTKNYFYKMIISKINKNIKNK